MNYKKLLSAISAAVISCSVGLSLAACGNEPWTPPKNEYTYNIPQDYCRTYYEIFLRSFADGDGDGIGDIRGLINNLDYLNDGDDSTMTDLGINGIWLMPFNASPSYHGYDVSDYKSIASDYGTLEDFDELVTECNKRGIWIQMDLVLNHTSSRHPWFTQALSDARAGLEPEESKWMQRYVFCHAKDVPGEGTYRKVSGTDYYYLGNFSSDMPDLNYGDMEENGLKKDVEQIVDFWLERGVKSFRLDAVPYVFGSSASNSSRENIEFWTWFNDYCDRKGAAVAAANGWASDGIGRYCYNVGEVWSNGSTINAYFDTGMSAFNYDMGNNATSGFTQTANNTYMAGAASLVYSIANLQTNVLGRDSNALLSNFLSNHDNDRSAGSLMYEPTRIKRAAGLYLLAPGNPYIYYGEELGAEGVRGAANTDANRRLPFNWGDESKGVTSAPDGASYSDGQRLGSWKDQTGSADSILTYYRNVIALRNRFPEIGRGKMSAYALDSGDRLVASAVALGSGTSFVKVNPSNKFLAAYTLEYNGSKLLIVQNVCDEEITLDISEFNGYAVVGEVKADGGKAAVSGNSLVISGGVAAVLKAA